MARLMIAVFALLVCAADARASAWPMPAMAADGPVFPVDVLEIQQRVEALEQELEQSRREHADAVTAMAGLLNAVESLQARMEATEKRQESDVERKAKAEPQSQPASQPAAQQAGRWVMQQTCEKDRWGRTICRVKPVWVQ